ncbi:MAG TPA: dual specificity protein phosphatase [Thermoguttaceae bacterium]|nr:dual specificity protein phosphatase [Thermoguttaceae bacterium]
MREIIAQKLWIGNARDTCDLSRVHDLGIHAVIDLAFEEPPPQLTRDLTYCRFPVVDGSGNAPELLYSAIATTSMLIRKQVPLLIACSAGMSRSPSILAASLALVHGQSPDATLQKLIEGNPHDVSPPLWADVKNAYNELVDSYDRVPGGTSAPGGTRR